MSGDPVLNQSQWLTGAAIHPVAVDMVQNAEREVFIMVSNFAQGQFEDLQLSTALSVFARSSRYAQLCILVSSQQRITPTAHPLLHLQHRLSSLVQIRQVLADDATDLDVLLVDQRHLLRLQFERHTQTAQHIQHAVPSAPQLAARFLHWWQRAQPIPELRRLLL